MPAFLQSVKRQQADILDTFCFDAYELNFKTDNILKK